ncbi:MAG: hypothetical protein WCI73_07960 [Phycisphaerae bacterium]
MAAQYPPAVPATKQTIILVDILRGGARLRLVLPYGVAMLTDDEVQRMQDACPKE